MHGRNQCVKITFQSCRLTKWSNEFEVDVKRSWLWWIGIVGPKLRWLKIRGPGWGKLGYWLLKWPKRFVIFTWGINFFRYLSYITFDNCPSRVGPPTLGLVSFVSRKRKKMIVLKGCDIHTFLFTSHTPYTPRLIGIQRWVRGQVNRVFISFWCVCSYKSSCFFK